MSEPKRLKDGRPCLLDDPDVNIAYWWIEHTGGWNLSDMPDVSDERTEELLDYFCGPEEVASDE